VTGLRGTVHFTYDPESDQCRNLGPLLTAIERLDDVALELHCSGLPVRDNGSRRYLESATSDASGDRTNAENSGVEDFAEVFETHLLFAAVLAAQSMDKSRSMAMLRALQAGIGTFGLHLADTDVLCGIAASLGLDRGDFAARLEAFDVAAHVEATREMLRNLPARAPRTLILEIEDRWIPLPYWEFARNPGGIGSWLQTRMKP
jgi:protein-disulfide isomerase-like protein with CxxC motif